MSLYLICFEFPFFFQLYNILLVCWQTIFTCSSLHYYNTTGFRSRISTELHNRKGLVFYLNPNGTACWGWFTASTTYFCSKLLFFIIHGFEQQLRMYDVAMPCM